MRFALSCVMRGPLADAIMRRPVRKLMLLSLHQSSKGRTCRSSNGPIELISSSCRLRGRERLEFVLRNHGAFTTPARTYWTPRGSIEITLAVTDNQEAGTNEMILCTPPSANVRT